MSRKSCIDSSYEKMDFFVRKECAYEKVLLFSLACNPLLHICLQ